MSTENLGEAQLPQALASSSSSDALADAMPRREFLKKAAAVGGTALAFGPLSQLMLGHAGAASVGKASSGKSMAKTTASADIASQFVADYAPKALVATDFSTQLASVDGISKKQLDEHLKLYEGYVKKYNDLQAQIVNYQNLDPATVNATHHPYRELVVEQTYAYNGVVLHEAYFGNLGGTANSQPSSLVRNLFSKEFGSWESYVTHLKAVAKASRGWAITAFNWRDGRIQNWGLDLHNQTVPWNVTPLLVLDVYEHAYMIDFATNRGAYLDAFLNNVDWNVVETRLDLIVQHLA